jgi:hypothetical protein
MSLLRFFLCFFDFFDFEVVEPLFAVSVSPPPAADIPAPAELDFGLEPLVSLAELPELLPLPMLPLEPLPVDPELPLEPELPVLPLPVLPDCANAGRASAKAAIKIVFRIVNLRGRSLCGQPRT